MNREETQCMEGGAMWLMQLVFFRLAQEVAEGYRGRFMGENL